MLEILIREDDIIKKYPYITNYEIKDIKVSESIRKVMNLEADSERKKRAEILLSEGRKMVEINMAEARKQSTVLQA